MRLRDVDEAHSSRFVSIDGPQVVVHVGNNSTSANEEPEHASGGEHAEVQKAEADDSQCYAIVLKRPSTLILAQEIPDLLRSPLNLMDRLQVQRW